MPRPWERFLTEQDRAHLEVYPNATVGFGERAALLLIDNYRSAVGDEPLPLLEGTQTWPNTTGLAGWRALEHIEKLLAGAREAGLPVVHITNIPEEDAQLIPWARATKAPRSPAEMSPEEADRHRRRYDFVEQAAPLPGETVIRKSSASAFWGTPLAGQLIGLGVDTVVVAGESTSGCVRSTVIDAAQYRFRVQVVEECVYDRHEATHAMNLFDMDRKFADVISLDTALDWILTKGAQR